MRKIFEEELEHLRKVPRAKHATGAMSSPQGWRCVFRSWQGTDAHCLFCWIGLWLLETVDHYFPRCSDCILKRTDRPYKGSGIGHAAILTGCS